MKIVFPLHCLSDVAFPSERKPNDPNDTHYSIFDSECGCVAHVFDRDVAVKMAKSFNCHDELVAACKSALKVVSEIADINTQNRAGWAHKALSDAIDRANGRE